MTELTIEEKRQAFNLIRRWAEWEENLLASPDPTPSLSRFVVGPSDDFLGIVSGLKPGDTLLLHGGVYEVSLFGWIPGGFIDKRVTLKSFPGEKAILRPPPGSFRVVHFGDNGRIPSREQNCITLDGLVLDGVNCRYDAIKIEGEAGYIWIHNCEILNAGTQGILIAEGAGGFNEISRNVIHGGGMNSEGYDSTVYNHGVYIQSSDNIVLDNVIYSIQGHGVHIYGGHPYNNRNVVKGNGIHDASMGAPRAPGIGLYSGVKHQAVNNVIWDSYQGIRVEYFAEQCIVEGNTIRGMEGAGIFIGQGNSGVGAADGTRVIKNKINGCGGIGIYAEVLSRNGFISGNELSGNGHLTQLIEDEKNLRNDSLTTVASDNLES